MFVESKGVTLLCLVILVLDRDGTANVIKNQIT